jgi:O-antigen/teichoic acid export membrane protein
VPEPHEGPTGVPAPAVLRPSPIVALAKQAVVYGISGVALQAIGLLTLPVFARVFTTAEYGKLELALALSAVALAVVDAGFASSAQRSFYDYREDQLAERKAVILTAFVSTSTIGVLVAAVLLAGRDSVADWLFGRSNEAALVAAVAISVPIVNSANFLRETMRLRFRAWHYVVSSILGSVIAAGLAIVAVVAFDLNVKGVFIGIIGGNLLAAAYGAIVVRDDIRGRFSRRELRTMLRYGLPLVPAAVALWALALVDRIMLSKLGNLRELGEYAVANRISNVLLLGVTGFALAFGPYIFSIYSEDRVLERAVRVQTLRYVAIGLSFAGLALALFARELIDVLAPAFDEAYKSVGLLAFAIVVFGVSTVVMSGISYARRTEYMAVTAVLAGAVNIGLNFALIPPYGMVGAAIANAIAYVVLTSAQYVIAQRLYPTAYELGKLVTIIGLASALGIIGVVSIHPLALAIVIKAATLASFPVLLWFTRVVAAQELESLREVVAGLWRLRAARA